MAKHGFPPGLLEAPPKKRLDFFDIYTTAHPLLLSTYEELLCAIRDSKPGSIILAFGPPGVGKTTLLQRMEKKLKEEALAELEEDRERLPVVRLEASSPQTGRFDWTDYFRRLLFELDEPGVNSKVDNGKWEAVLRQNRHMVEDQKTSGAKLRRAAEQALLRRRPMAVMVDDAQHFAVVGSGRRLLDQLNTIKSVANMTRTTHVLCGTYELLPFRNLSGQLSRRSVDVHFQRYHADDPEQRQAFINVLATFQGQMPLAETPDLIEGWDYFFERSIGCVGVLKDWLSRALALALREGGDRLLRRHLEKRALSIAQCSQMLAEVVEGERRLAESEEARVKLRTHLGLEAAQESPAGIPATPQPVVSRRGRRVGIRRPVRDAIGVKTA